jgi:hypothetical protein
VCWPHFGLTRTPKADNCCALLRDILAGQRPKSLARRAPVYIYGSDELEASGGEALQGCSCWRSPGGFPTRAAMHSGIANE